MSPKFRTAALGFATAAALALPASAMADTSLLDSLSSPASIDGHTYTAKQMKHRFAGKNLFFVLGSKEEGAGAVAAFHSKGAAKAYVADTGRAPKKGVARAAYNGYQTVFYSDAFLEGASIAARLRTAASATSRSHCMISQLWWCNTTWDNQISLRQDGYSRRVPLQPPVERHLRRLHLHPGPGLRRAVALLQRRDVVVWVQAPAFASRTWRPPATDVLRTPALVEERIR